MQVKRMESTDGDGRVEAHLRLDRSDVIAGEIVGVGGSRRFHGWLELMDALDALRSPELRDQQEV